MSGASELRALLRKPGPILAPGVYDCLSARIVERAGFPVAFISGAAVTASVLGYPDVGLQAMPEILNQSRNIARCVSIPVLIDVDTGYGNALNVMRTVREFEAAGLAGIFFEDQTFPKRCGHFEGKKVIPAEEMAVKIKAACEARRNSDFVIIARTDSRALLGLDDAIARSQRYVEAGADIIFVEAMLSVEEMKKVAGVLRVPLQANLGEGGKTPMVHYQELHDAGFKLISYSGTLQRTAIRGNAGCAGGAEARGHDEYRVSREDLQSGRAQRVVGPGAVLPTRGAAVRPDHGYRGIVAQGIAGTHRGARRGHEDTTHLAARGGPRVRPGTQLAPQRRVSWRAAVVRHGHRGTGHVPRLGELFQTERWMPGLHRRRPDEAPARPSSRPI